MEQKDYEILIQDLKITLEKTLCEKVVLEQEKEQLLRENAFLRQEVVRVNH